MPDSPRPTRRLILMRHAKAEVGGADRDDHARALARRGREDAERIGLLLDASGWSPDLVVASDSRRTRETATIVAATFGAAVPSRFDPALYGASPEAILDVVAATPAAVRTLLVIGHNPGIGQLSRRLGVNGEAEALARLAARFPTSACALLDLAGDAWDDAGLGDATLAALLWADPAGGPD